jgi:hypothetical protein
MNPFKTKRKVRQKDSDLSFKSAIKDTPFRGVFRWRKY